MVEENNNIRKKIPEQFSFLMKQHLEQVDEVISPGLTVLRWTSVDIESYTESVMASLKEFKLLLDRVLGIIEFRIEGVLHDIQHTDLCELPDNTPVTIHEFVNHTEVC